jgi:hypothetical protein
MVLAVTTVAWVALFVVRLHTHQAFVDDYLYASTSRSLYSGGNVLHNLLSTGQTSPLVPALAVPGTWIGGLYGSMTVELPFLLLVVAGAYALARQWIAPRPSAVVAFVAGLNCGVLGYSVMLNFSAAATAALLWCLVAYVASDRLRGMRWSVGFGAAAAALLLARTMAPVYAAPLALVLGVDLVIDRVRRRPLDWRPVAVAGGIVAVAAGPWWAVSGPTAMHYLLHAGYQPSSGLVTRGWDLSPAAVWSRVYWELAALGQLEAWVLGVAVAYALVVTVIRRREFATGPLILLPVWALLCTLLLSTSGNPGTGFGLPVVAVVIVWCGVVIVRGPRPSRVWWAPLLAAVLLVTAAGVGATFTMGNGPLLHGPPYRPLAGYCMATSRTNLDQITAEVAHDAAAAGRQPGSASGRPAGGDVLLTVDAPLVNYNGIAWNLDDRGLYPPATDLATATTEMEDAGAAVLGSYTVVYDQVSQAAMVAAAMERGFAPVHVWKVGTCSYAVVWAHGAADRQAAGLATRTAVLGPKQAASVHGSVVLVGGVLGGMWPAAVEFRITGNDLAHPVTIGSTSNIYGWIGSWESTDVPNGTYDIRSGSVSAVGVRWSEAVTTVRVAN